MTELRDFIILQRDLNNTATAVFSGDITEKEDVMVLVNVYREDDNSIVIPWTECNIDNGKWYCELSLPAGGLYRAEARICAGEFNAYNNRYDWCTLIKSVKHIGVGDVFVLAGQSNMSGYGRDPAYDPPVLGVHMLNNRNEWEIASHPLNSCVNPVFRNNDPNSGTSPGLSFGRMISVRLGIPVGLVCAAQGGSSLEKWDPDRDNCYLFEDMKKRIEYIGDFTALIWSQGCNEAGDEEEAAAYFDNFSRVIGRWYDFFGKKPIIVCQMNRHAYKAEGNDRYWGLVREAQRKISLVRDSVFTIPTMDLFTVDGIHNSSASCITVGERIANVLLYNHYHTGGYDVPTVRKITKIDSRHILLHFTGKHIMRTMDDIATGLNIEDEAGLMNCIKISVCNEGAVVEAERKIIGEAVFHAYWRREVPAFFIRDINSVPITACYGVKIEE